MKRLLLLGGGHAHLFEMHFGGIGGVPADLVQPVGADAGRVGEPGPSIAALARETGCDMIVMGTRGLGAPTGALLGSVAQATLEAAAMPVLLIR